MKIVFNKLQTSKETIQISLDGGTTYIPYEVSEIINDGIPLDENQDLEKIQIKGSSSVLKNLDVVMGVNVISPQFNSEHFYIWGCYYGEFCITFTRNLKVGDIVLTIDNNSENNLQFDEIIGIRGYDENGEINEIDIRGIGWYLQTSVDGYTERPVIIGEPFDRNGNYLQE